MYFSNIWISAQSSHDMFRSTSNWRGHLENGNNLGDVSVHLVKVGVLGGRLPVPAASHGVHNVLSGDREIIGKPFVTSFHTWMRAK